jgi:tRNA(adenine34) deaminase
MMNSSDLFFMREALGLARQGSEEGEIPVGAVVVLAGQMIGMGSNRGLRTHDPTAHAEIVALKMAAESCRNYRLSGTTLYVTLEPCFMCFGAMIESRIERLVFAAREPLRGVTGSIYDLHNDPRLNHRIIVMEGIMAQESHALMQTFFEKRRGEKQADP